MQIKGVVHLISVYLQVIQIQIGVDLEASSCKAGFGKQPMFPRDVIYD